MYKLLCIGKCACFLLLVMMMVSVLTCSGFRIDSSNSGVAPSTNDNMLPRDDQDEQNNSDDNHNDMNNNQYSSSSDRISDNLDYINREGQVRSDRTSNLLFSDRTSIPDEFNSANSSLQMHRFRHRRSRQNHHHFKSEASPPYQPRSSQSNYHHKELQQQNLQKHSQRLLQETPTNKKHHTNNKNNRNNNNKRRKQEKDNERQPKNCQQQNVARKAYLANTVVLAKVVSRNLERVHNYSVTFRIQNLRQHVFKKQYDVDSDIRLTFLNNTSKMTCETPMRRTHGGGGAFAGPVKAQIQPSKKYFLFLNSTGSHDYTVIGMPVPYKEKILAVIKRVTSASFEPRLEVPRIQVRTAGGTMWNVTSSSSGDYLEVKPGQKIRLECKVEGFPIPLITWEKNDTRVTANNTRVIYRGKKATLVIKQARPQDSGVYRCVAWYGVDSKTKHAQSPEIRISNSAPCSERFNTTFCQNGGKCRVAEVHEPVLFCICPDGFTGERCEAKSVENSMYMQKTSCAENYMC